MAEEKQRETGQADRPEGEANGLSDRVFLHGMQPNHFGVMDHPDGHAVVTGPCGDTDEFFL
jgi:hypothetical protein